MRVLTSKSTLYNFDFQNNVLTSPLCSFCVERDINLLYKSYKFNSLVWKSWITNPCFAIRIFVCCGLHLVLNGNSGLYGTYNLSIIAWRVAPSSGSSFCKWSQHAIQVSFGSSFWKNSNYMCGKE